MNPKNEFMLILLKFVCFCYYEVLLPCMFVMSRNDALSFDDNPYSTIH